MSNNFNDFMFVSPWQISRAHLAELYSPNNIFDGSLSYLNNLSHLVWGPPFTGGKSVEIYCT